MKQLQPQLSIKCFYLFFPIEHTEYLQKLHGPHSRKQEQKTVIYNIPLNTGSWYCLELNPVKVHKAELYSHPRAWATGLLFTSLLLSRAVKLLLSSVWSNHFMNSLPPWPPSVSQSASALCTSNINKVCHSSLITAPHPVAQNKLKHYYTTVYKHSSCEPWSHRPEGGIRHRVWHVWRRKCDTLDFLCESA